MRPNVGSSRKLEPLGKRSYTRTSLAAMQWRELNRENADHASVSLPALNEVVWNFFFKLLCTYAASEVCMHCVSDSLQFDLLLSCYLG